MKDNLTRKLKYLHSNPNEVMLLTYQGSDTSKNLERQILDTVRNGHFYLTFEGAEIRSDRKRTARYGK